MLYFYLNQKKYLLDIFTPTGKGSDGCLGHGTLESSNRPKIVESLLGEEISHVAVSDKHVIASTSAKEVYAWGRNEDSCLGFTSKCILSNDRTLTKWEKKKDIKTW